MTTTLAVIGKSGSGKTSVTKAIFKSFHEIYPDKSILLLDTDLTCELACTFGVEVSNTVYDIKMNKFDYKTRLPENMSRQEFIEWALQDIMINIHNEIDLIAVGPISSKDCRCYIAEKINDALIKLIESYDLVIIDCEYDLVYLQHLVDYHVDVTLIVAETSCGSVYSAAKIKESSFKLASPGQIGLMLNKVKNRMIPEHISNLLCDYDLDILGTLPYDANLEKDCMLKESDILNESVKELLFRLNLPQ